MRPIALLGLTLTLTFPLSGCGDTWWNPPLTGGYNPHAPAVDSENMRRVMGQDTPEPALVPEPGDVWPGPLPPSPTLSDMELQSGNGTGGDKGSSAPTDTSGTGSLPAPYPARGSSTPPTAAAPPPPAPTHPSMRAGVAAAPPRDPSGQIIQTDRGPAVTTGGGPGYQTTTMPGGGTAIVLPNGNGTSTVIHPDGHIETIPTAK